MDRPFDRRRRRHVTLSIAALVFGTAAFAVAQSDLRGFGATVNLVGVGGDVSARGAVVSVTGAARGIGAAGASVSVKAAVADDLWAAGADITVDSAVGGDLWALGGKVDVRGSAGGGVWLGGAVIDANLTVGGNMKAGAARISVGPASDIRGSIFLAGANVTFAGHVAGDVGLAGARVTFDGRADKSVSVDAAELIVGPNATIGGDLVLVGETKANVDPAAKITGSTVHRDRETWWQGPPVDPRPGQFGFAIFIAGTAILAGLGLMLLGRPSFDDAASRARNKPLRGLLTGIVTLVLIPVVAAGLAITGIGIPLAIGLLLLIPLLLIIGHATAALGIADWLFNRENQARRLGWSLMLLAVGAIGIALIGLIPFVGPIFVFVVLILGVGAFLTALRSRLRWAAPA